MYDHVYSYMRGNWRFKYIDLKLSQFPGSMNVTDYARDAKVPNTSAMRNKWYNQKITHTKPGKVRHVECRNLQPLTNAEFLRIRRARIRHEQEKLEMDTEEASIKPKSVLDKDGLRKLSASIRNHEKAKAKKKAKK